MEQTAEIAGTLVGIAYLYWEYRADRKVWLAGIVMPAISLYVYWQAGLYADFGINVYYLLAAVYGLWVWTAGGRSGAGSQRELPITPTPRRMWPRLLAAFALTFAAIGLLLLRHTDSNVPWWDAFTTALSIVGMWMLARKWLEQWVAWIAVDLVSSGLYVYKGIFFYAALYALYTVVALFGYVKWKRMMNTSGRRKP